MVPVAPINIDTTFILHYFYLLTHSVEQSPS